ncbi:MAG: hypothetical protein ABJP33_11135 [Pseudoruegeria sp.]
MMNLFAYPLRAIRQFLKNRDGGMSIEAALVFPMLFFGIGITYMYYDAFRIRTANLKATYTIGDLLSRWDDKENGVDQAYIDGLGDIFDYLTDDTDNSWIRISVIKYDPDDDTNYLQWSKSSDSHPVNTQIDIDNLADQIPVLADDDYVIITETFMDFSSAFGDLPWYNGWFFDEISFENFAVTSLRFLPKLEEA